MSLNNIDLNKAFTLKLTLINQFIFSLVNNIKDAFRSIFVKKEFYKKNFLEHLRSIVWTCLPIATLTIGTSSVIYSIHVAPAFVTHGLTTYFGGGVAVALIRESVPVLASLAIVTQYCSGMSAQIASMKITEQLDAMKISNVNPISYILVPMLSAGIVGFPLIVIISIFTGILFNFLSAHLLIDITSRLYTSSISHVVQFKDIFLSLTKAVVFGFTVTLISYNCGVLARGGAKAVGNATRTSVVINFALVIILDYIITAIWL